jgi:prolyl oligopeptidase PreP (S9A serine peptidase family)
VRTVAFDHPHCASASIDVRAGHGAGKPTAKKIEEWADIWAFVERALDVIAASARP